VEIPAGGSRNVRLYMRTAVEDDQVPQTQCMWDLPTPRQRPRNNGDCSAVRRVSPGGVGKFERGEWFAVVMTPPRNRPCSVDRPFSSSRRIQGRQRLPTRAFPLVPKRPSPNVLHPPPAAHLAPYSTSERLQKASIPTPALSCVATTGYKTTRPPGLCDLLPDPNLEYLYDPLPAERPLSCTPSLHPLDIKPASG
jgi:hypothetical protein